MAYDVRNVKNMTGLIRYFSQNLNWNIDIEDFDDIEDISYDFEAEDIELKEEAFVKISSLRQLQPLVDNQKWGIFCVEFDSDKFEVSALRKILSGLVPKRRNSTNHPVWNQQDLLFICSWGNNNNYTIGIAYFEDKGFGLPQIKMISCAPAVEDFTQIRMFESKLSKLKWPEDTSNIEEWRESWASAFTSGYHEIIRDSVTLTVQLAAEAQNIRNRILDSMEVESANGYVHLLYEKFRNTLIHDMTKHEFADMYAQTVVYGLFSARCMDTQDGFSATRAVECIPNTNPFLESLMRECIGAENNSKLSFDELEINNVVDLLLHTNTETIIQDFNRQTGGGREDPVIHFYEEFLEAYDKTQKIQRGVYYTPQPVVNFIVSAVDSILKEEFNMCEGLASEEIKKIKIKRKSKRKKDGLLYTEVEDTINVPAIQVLDPATGTGTFLRQIILQIYENFKQRHKDEHPEQVAVAWNKYVPEHLLPRLNGFELMMAPYAVAHMKLAMVLKDTGYDFNSKERLNVYLTNTLEEAGSADNQIALWDDPLAVESVEANGVKKNNGINIIIGNPPYNVSSNNRNEWIQNLLADFKQGLTERKLNLDDDYIKFLKYAQMVVERAGAGIVAFITNNSYIDGVSHRRIRESLMETFNKIYILDLHGNVMKKEKTADGGKDENVFDITQGVSICLLIKGPKNKKSEVYHYDLIGTREKKYEVLSTETISSLQWSKLNPKADKYLFVPFDESKQACYEQGICVSELFELFNSGIQTKCDELSVGFSQVDVESTVQDFLSLDVEQLRAKYPNKKDSSGWKFEKAKAEIITGNYQITPYYYRPFDYRYTVYTGKSGGFIGRSRESVMKHIVGHENNPGLCMMKQFFQDTIYNHILYTNLPIDERTLYSNRGGTYLFPLYRYYNEFGTDKRQYNFKKDAILKFEEALQLKLTEEDSDQGFSGEKLLQYIYAVLYSPSYRKTFNEYLKYDFPRIPLPKNKRYFNDMAVLGKEMIELHTPKEFIRAGSNKIVISTLTSYTYDKNKHAIVLNKSYMIPISDEGIYEYEIGGYKPLQKWMKDRKGLPLTQADLDCYKKIIDTILKTKKISERIDTIFEL